MAQCLIENSELLIAVTMQLLSGEKYTLCKLFGNEVVSLLCTVSDMDVESQN